MTEEQKAEALRLIDEYEVLKAKTDAALFVLVRLPKVSNEWDVRSLDALLSRESLHRAEDALLTVLQRLPSGVILLVGGLAYHYDLRGDDSPYLCVSTTVRLRD